MRRFKVTDQEVLRSELAGWACFRLDRLRLGYRFIHLYDAHGVPSNGILLVKIDKVFRKADGGTLGQMEATQTELLASAEAVKASTGTVSSK